MRFLRLAGLGRISGAANYTEIDVWLEEATSATCRSGLSVSCDPYQLFVAELPRNVRRSGALLVAWLPLDEHGTATCLAAVAQFRADRNYGISGFTGRYPPHRVPRLVRRCCSHGEFHLGWSRAGRAVAEKYGAGRSTGFDPVPGTACWRLDFVRVCRVARRVDVSRDCGGIHARRSRARAIQSFDVPDGELAASDGRSAAANKTPRPRGPRGVCFWHCGEVIKQPGAVAAVMSRTFDSEGASAEPTSQTETTRSRGGGLVWEQRRNLGASF